MAIKIETTADKFPQLTLHIFEILIPIIGECLGNKLNVYLGAVQELANDESDLESRREAARILLYLLPAFRDYQSKSQTDGPVYPAWFQGVIDGKRDDETD
jgi:hypothetical protein